MKKHHSLLVEDESDGVGEGVVLCHDGEGRGGRFHHRTMLHRHLPRVEATCNQKQRAGQIRVDLLRALREEKGLLEAAELQSEQDGP